MAIIPIKETAAKETGIIIPHGVPLFGELVWFPLKALAASSLSNFSASEPFCCQTFFR